MSGNLESGGMMDFTKLQEKLNPKPDGESPVRHRSGVVDAVNADGTVDLDLGGTVVPDVSVLEGAVVEVGDTVQVAVWAGDLLVLGRAAAAQQGWQDWAAADANLNIGSTGTKVARYKLDGETVHWVWSVVLGGTGISVGAVEITLPFTPAAHYVEDVSHMGNGILLDSGTTTYHAACRLDASGTQAAIRYFGLGGSGSQTVGLSSTAPFTWVAGDRMTMDGFYERA